MDPTDEDRQAPGNHHSEEGLSVGNAPGFRANSRSANGPKQRLEREEFLAMLGHELRTPLAAISNTTKLLRSAHGPGDVHLDRLVQVLERQTNHMRHIVDDLLDVTRIEGGKIRLQLEHVDLAEVVQAVAEDQAAMLQAKDLQVRLEIPRQSWWVRGDRVRLTQVVHNLVDNAVKYTDAPGWVLLRMQEGVVAGTELVQLSVIDSGCGMDEEMLKGAFEPFWQAGRTIERSGGGLGLGLSLVRALVELHGGWVEAFSEGAGCGTEMRVTLPRCTVPLP